MRLKSMCELLTILLGNFFDVFGGLLKLCASITNHLFGLFYSFKHAIDHARIHLVVIFLQVLRRDAL